jgi:hypothetical protein
MHQQAGTGIWNCDMSKKAQKQHHKYKKVTRKQGNRNWQGSRHIDLEAVNQQKSLEALRLLRQADQALDKICKFLADCTKFG